ncbi:Os02g0695550 [Oryza sativa Japonica Group]|uniref:Os02g0695550 protein n=1 Tax=Oryza sativa subsp. japonica TaxID=39947 RepID=A0A0P0VND3_ORYSJ|nr:Os02g0695550 [Oryza sativa Japonica Group]
MSTWCRTSRRTTSPTRCDTDALVMRSAAITGHALLRPCLVPHRRAARLVIPIAVASAISVDSEGRCQRAEAVPRGGNLVRRRCRDRDSAPTSSSTAGAVEAFAASSAATPLEFFFLSRFVIVEE